MRNLTPQESNESTFQRSPHNKQNPYTMISNDLIRDQNLSLECRGLIIYLLSHNDGWCIRISQLLDHLKPQMGRDKLRRLIREAANAGYMRVENVPHRNLIRLVYYVSETPEFKECFRETGFQGPGASGADKTPPKNTITKKEQVNTYLNKSIVSEPAEPAGRPISFSKPKKEIQAEMPLSPLTQYFYEKLIEINPKLKQPNLKKWDQEMLRAQTVDGRTEEELRKAIDYLVRQHKEGKKEFTWAKAVASPDKLRKHFASIWLEMNHKTEDKKKEESQDHKVNVIKENREWAKTMRIKVAASLPEDMFFNVADTAVSFGDRSRKTHYVLGYSENGFKETVNGYFYKRGIKLN